MIFQEILTGNLSDQHYHDLFSGNDGIIPKLNQLQKTFTEITQRLTAFQIARIFIGPILTYVLQNKLLGLPVDDSDLTLIQKQILANLTLEYKRKRQLCWCFLLYLVKIASSNHHRL